MTVGELIVYNSTLGVGGGTVLSHLMHVAVTREVFCGVNVDVADGIDITVSSAIISANINKSVVAVDFTSGTGINIKTIPLEVGT